MTVTYVLLCMLFSFFERRVTLYLIISKSCNNYLPWHQHLCAIFHILVQRGITEISWRLTWIWWPVKTLLIASLQGNARFEDEEFAQNQRILFLPCRGSSVQFYNVKLNKDVASKDDAFGIVNVRRVDTEEEVANLRINLTPPKSMPEPVSPETQRMRNLLYKNASRFICHTPLAYV